MVIALTLILLGYLLPHLVRTRQLLLDSRVEDRFSGDLRILATVGSEQVDGGRPRSRAGSAEPGAHHREVAARPYLHDPARRPEASMNRPRARTERAIEDARALAAARAARAARVSRRAAAARRRLILTVALLLASAGAWAAVATAGAALVLAIVPTLLLTSVLVLGRRTAVKAAANDKRDRAEMARLEARLKAMSRRAAAAPPRRSAGPVAAPAGATSTGRARPPATAPAGSGSGDVEASVDVSDSAHDVEAPAAVVVAVDRADDDAPAEVVLENAQADDVVEAPAAAAVATEELGDDDVEAPVEGESTATSTVEPWTPVPVPAPSYTLKQTTPRRDVAPYAGEAATPSASVPQRPTAASPASAPAPVEEPVAVTLDLDAVLARRRAAGE